MNIKFFFFVYLSLRVWDLGYDKGLQTLKKPVWENCLKNLLQSVFGPEVLCHLPTRTGAVHNGRCGPLPFFLYLRLVTCIFKSRSHRILVLFSVVMIKSCCHSGSFPTTLIWNAFCHYSLFFVGTLEGSWNIWFEKRPR